MKKVILLMLTVFFAVSMTSLEAQEREKVNIESVDHDHDDSGNELRPGFIYNTFIDPEEPEHPENPFPVARWCQNHCEVTMISYACWTGLWNGEDCAIT